MTWILTHTGKRPDLLHPRIEDICLEDIAHALARIGRFTGHGDCFISVAQHCVHVSDLCPFDLKPWGLLHDATEAYLGDVSSPLKQALRTGGGRYTNLRPSDIDRDWPAPLREFASLYDALQDSWQDAISTRFSVPVANVKRWDIQSAMTERRDNGPHGADEIDWFGAGRICPEGIEPDWHPIIPWTPARAEVVYLDVARRLRIK